MNGIMLQGFEWYLSDDGNYYKEMINHLDHLKSIGVTSIWLPPVTKATGTQDTGYGIYDLYDLGEFDQKGSVRTKYGTKDELHELIDAIHDRGLRVYCDVVLNHKAAADDKETFKAVEVDQNDRNKEIGEAHDITAWTKFTFPGRDGKYSEFTWDYRHFNGVDYDVTNDQEGIFRICGDNKGWNYGVSNDFGNYDYLMYANIDHAHPEVKEELIKWMHWFIETLNIDGVRLDAVKHIDHNFMESLVDSINDAYGKEFYVLGEYWDQRKEQKQAYLEETEYKIDLFDVGLHYHFHQASVDEDYDLRHLFDDTLIEEHPTLAVTFVDNHDSQPGQSLESYVEPWFKPHAYAVILLRKDGYPVIFYGDYFGIKEPEIEPFNEIIDTLSKLRKQYAYGDEKIYYEGQHCLGFVRTGDEDHPDALVTILSTKDESTIKMLVGKSHEGKVFADFLGNHEAKVTIDEEGYGEFPVSEKTVSVYLEDGLELE